MNTRQKYALWVGIALMGMMCLFPPQIIVPSLGLMDVLKSQWGGSGLPAPLLPHTRYSFLFAPPPGSVGIDWERFLLPLFFLLAVTAGAILTLQTRPAGPQTPASAA